MRPEDILTRVGDQLGLDRVFGGMVRGIGVSTIRDGRVRFIPARTRPRSPRCSS